MYPVPIILSLVLAGPLDRAPSVKNPAPCAPHARAVVVDVTARTLSLCENGEARRVFPVSLGTGGVGKRQQGDHRTPLGSYPLGVPRRSQQYGTFIPVGYPTPRQVEMGFTGTAVGIHGPPRAFVNGGRSNTSVDWTWGCIAVGSDPEIQEISAWVNRRARTWVHIIPIHEAPKNHLE
jgi:murein L,D-transpeptidase YafK